MPAHKNQRQKALIRLAHALVDLYNSVPDPSDMYTREDAMVIHAAMERADWADLLKEAATHTGRDEHGVGELELFVDEDMHERGFDPFEWLPAEACRLTAAEFHCLRQQLGLTTKWLADRWDVTERSVQRWENNRRLPFDLTEDMLGLRDTQLRTIRTQCDEITSSMSGLFVPRKNIMPTEYPAEWWQIIAWHVHERTGATILYVDDTSEDLEAETDDPDGDDE